MGTTRLDCTGEPGCETSQLVLTHDTRLDTLEAEALDDRTQWREGLTRVRERMDTLILLMLGTVATSLAGLVIQLLKK